MKDNERIALGKPPHAKVDHPHPPLPGKPPHAKVDHPHPPLPGKSPHAK